MSFSRVRPGSLVQGRGSDVSTIWPSNGSTFDEEPPEATRGFERLKDRPDEPALEVQRRHETSVDSMRILSSSVY